MGLRLVDDERALFERWVSARDEAAVAELWRRHQRLAVHLVARVLHRRPNAPELAREICDEAFVQALGSFQPSRAAHIEQPFRAWFLTIARSRALDLLRRPVDPVDDAPASVSPDQVQRLLADEQIDQARTWVLEHFLPSDWQAVLHHAEGYSWAEIAAANPIALDVVLPFAPGSAELTGDPAPVLRTLTLSPKLEVRILGQEGEDEPGLGLARARAVRSWLTERAPAVKARLKVLAAEGPPEVRFEVSAGAERTADAQRMRTQTILRRYRKVVGAA